MTDPNTARESARQVTGQFGLQDHSTPETVLDSAQSVSAALYDLSYVYGADAARADEKCMDLRIASFVEEARENMPEATGAVFDWGYDEGAVRLNLSHYVDEAGEVLDIEEYPLITDFLFDEARGARRTWFVESETIDGATLTFADVPSPDPERVKAELLAGDKLSTNRQGPAIRALLNTVMWAGFPPQRVASLTEADIHELQLLIERTAAEAWEYLSR